MTNRLKTAILVFATFVLFVPNFAKAEIPITSVQRNINRPFDVSPSDKENICQKLFEGDSYNVFGEIVCDLLSIISKSATNLSTEIVCTIQSVGINGNFVGPRVIPGGVATFTYQDGGGCIARGGLGGGADNQIFGDKVHIDPTSGASTGSDTGFNASITPSGTSSSGPPSSQLTHMLLDNGSFVKSAFAGMRIFSIIIALVCAFLIGFAQILHINVNTYAIKKALPQIALAVVGGFFGLTIVGLASRLIDFLYRFSFFSPYQLLHPFTNIFGGSFDFGSMTSIDVGGSMSLMFTAGAQIFGSTSASAVNFVSGFFGFVILVIPAIVTFAFEYVLALRPIAVEMLAIVSPIAFALLILPQTQWIFKKWWTYLLIALVYPLGISLLFSIINLADLPAGATSIEFLLRWLVKIALFVVVIRIPFTIEKDLSRTGDFLTNSKFATSLGLNRLVAKQNQPVAVPAEKIISSEAKLSQRLSQNIVAPIRSSSSQQVKELQRNFLKTGLSRTQRADIVASSSSINLNSLAEQAHSSNLTRSPNTLIQSIKDIRPEVFKQILSKSDSQVWKENNLVKELKTKDGQSLDDSGAAIRADAIRKVVRIAEHAEGEQLQNPQALKLLAQKGALGTLPAGTIKAALDQQIISEADLSPSFGANTQKVKDYVKNYTGKAGISGKQVVESIKNDQIDFQSGYFDLNAGINNAIAIKLPPTKDTATRIINGVRSTDPAIFDRAFDRFGDHFLRRIGQDLKSSQTKVEQRLVEAGIDKSEAKNLSLASSANVEQAISKIPQDKKSPETISLLKESFAQKDLHKNVADQIANMATEDKKVISSAIADKVINAQNTEQTNLEVIEGKVQDAAKKLGIAKTEDEMKSASEQINEYYPISPLEEKDAKYDESTIEKFQKRATDILETLGILKESKDPKTGVIDPKTAQATIAQGISDQINNLVYSNE